MRAIQIKEFGGPEVLQLTDLPDPEPRDGEVTVNVSRAGINFADTHLRRDDYLAPAELPLIPGMEVSGRTEGGDRVTALLSNGGYAEKVAVPGESLVPVPDAVSDDQAAGGGTGTLAVQLAKRLGAGRVIALASSAQKRELALRLGADAAVDSRSDDLATAILDANGGEQVDVVLEMSGGSAFDACLSTLAPFGRLVTFGLASGKPNKVRNADLMASSRAVVGFWLVHLFKRSDLMREGIGELLAAVASGELEPVIGEVYGLPEAPRAHNDLQERRTTGKLLLDVSR
jgi:NADPH2:quinone reductase